MSFATVVTKGSELELWNRRHGQVVYSLHMARFGGLIKATASNDVLVAKNG